MLSGDSHSGVTDTVNDTAGDTAVSEETAASGDTAASGVPVIEAAFLANVVATIEQQVEILGRIDMSAASTADQRALLVRMETATRSLFGYSHTWLADLMAQRGLDDIYGSVPQAVAVLLRVSVARASQRIRFADEYGHRTSMTGERLDPVLPATASAAESGALDEEHQRIIKNFFRLLGRKVDIESRERAENQLAQLARELLPDQFRAAAARLFAVLDPDGELDDEEKTAARCFVSFDDPGADGLTKGKFLIDAETRAYLEAGFAKWAKPGMCNPADSTPVVDDPNVATNSDKNTSGSESDAATPDPSLFEQSDDSDTDQSSPGDEPDRTDVGTDATAGPGTAAGPVPGPGPGTAADRDTIIDAERRAARDHRSKGRRQHDALKVILRQMLASGQLGHHRGLPVTAVVTMTLKELEEASGHAVTGTGSLIPMRDAIRMASHAHQYLVIFDDHGRPLHLGRSKRIATADQRIVLIAADRGCTFPGCTRPATWSQVHHIDEWAAGGNTDIDSLTFGCDTHHPLVGPADTDWATTKAGPDHPYPGRTLWHPPIGLDPLRRGRINHFHHPNEYIYPADVPLSDTGETRDTNAPSPGGSESGTPPA
ncbi:HNH endonuclease signature motif containing protein [Rhodococcus sovatensis]|uniref:DUF222 domain-containing protein n=1 Tax=Rhodococcus sovatensis TaxID=1805840 RepID=A0ABZ2PG39_9NOCA